LFHGTPIYIESYYKTFLQIFFDMEDEITSMFTYIDDSLHKYYNSMVSETQIGIVAGHKQLKCEDSEPKMVF